MKTICFVNLSANGDKAQKKWNKIRSYVEGKYPKLKVIKYRGHFDFNLKLWINKGFTHFITAGGDGTHHYFLQSFMKFKKQDNLFWGAIGIGSSNDFLKPNNKIVADTPCKINPDDYSLVDIGLAEWVDHDGIKRSEYFCANASVGFTAQANHLFNKKGFFIDFFKKWATNLAILYTAVKTSWFFKNIEIDLSFENYKITVPLTNLNVVKIPYIAGSFYYQHSVARDDGLLGVYLSYDMNLLKLLFLLYKTNKGEFENGSKMQKVFTQKISLKCSEYFIFEIDGETRFANELVFSVEKTSLRCLNF